MDFISTMIIIHVLRIYKRYVAQYFSMQVYMWLLSTDILFKWLHWGPNSPIKHALWEILKRYGRQKSFFVSYGRFFHLFWCKMVYLCDEKLWYGRYFLHYIFFGYMVGFMWFIWKKLPYLANTYHITYSKIYHML